MIEINFIQLAVLITTRMSVGIRARKEASAVLTLYPLSCARVVDSLRFNGPQERLDYAS
jgi:hypothetical protein